jgi:cell wall-associated NlpC family hydrolase
VAPGRRVSVLAAVLWAAAFAAGCAGPRRVSHHYNVKPVPARAILKAAVSQLGKPYAYGGHDPHAGFDCSGLVYWCYGQFGSAMPRTAHEQFRVGAPVAKSELRAGDLVFFDTASGPEKPGHVGIMLNHGRFIHSPGSGETVREDELANNYWKKTYYGARRVE